MMLTRAYPLNSIQPNPSPKSMVLILRTIYFVLFSIEQLVLPYSLGFALLSALKEFFHDIERKALLCMA